jgi:PhzF family phenazine biosynthesis protein
VQVDAFAGQVFSGNPAAVCPLETWLPDAQMQAIAAEINLADTAFFVRNGSGYQLRWFTPLVEVEPLRARHAGLGVCHSERFHAGRAFGLV